MADLLMESGKEEPSANSLFCLWAHKFSNRTMLSWVLNYMDSCVLELPCSWYIHPSTSLGWFHERFCFFVLCILILKSMGQRARATGRKNLTCSFWFLLVLECAYFIDFQIFCYKIKYILNSDYRECFATPENSDSCYQTSLSFLSDIKYD